MKKFGLIFAALIVLGGSVFADAISSGTGSFSGNNISATPIQTFITGSATYSSSSDPGINALAFWNNPSSDGVSPVLVDGHVANVGDVIAGLATGTDLIGSNLIGTPSTTTPNTATMINGSYYSMAGGTDPAATSSGTSMTPALEFSFVSQQTSQTISLLFADSGNDTGNVPGATSVGIYILENGACGTNCQFTSVNTLDAAVADNTSGTAQTLVSGSTLVANAGTVYGYYATVCYDVVAGVCTESITYTTGAGNFSSGFTAGAQMLGALGWNHFALFQLANGEEVLGFTDTPYSVATNTEGQGDFNDVVLGIVGNAAPTSAIPEPATLAIMGLGLTGLGVLARRRFGKK